MTGQTAARVVRVFRVDGELQPGSDPQPEPDALRKASIRQAGLISLGVALLVIVVNVVARMN